MVRCSRKIRMKEYELMYIVPAKLEKAKQEAIITRVSGYIEKFGGIVQDHELWMVRKLSYAINHIRQGAYILGHFSIDPAKLYEFEREMRLDEDIVRHLVVVFDDHLKMMAKKMKQTKALPQQVREEREEKVAPNSVATEPKEEVDLEEQVSMEELDKKLEEILSDDTEVK